MTDDEALAWEITENLHRLDLTAAERRKQVKLLADVFERLDKPGHGDRVSNKGGRGKKGIASKVAEATGMSDRQVRRILAEDKEPAKADPAPAVPNHTSSKKADDTPKPNKKLQPPAIAKPDNVVSLPVAPKAPDKQVDPAEAFLADLKARVTSQGVDFASADRDFIGIQAYHVAEETRAREAKAKKAMERKAKKLNEAADATIDRDTHAIIAWLKGRGVQNVDELQARFTATLYRGPQSPLRPTAPSTAPALGDMLPVAEEPAGATAPTG